MFVCLGIFYKKYQALLTRVYYHGNVCCKPNLPLTRLNCRLEINRYEITADRPMSSSENKVTIPRRALGHLCTDS